MLHSETDARRLLISERIDELTRDFQRSQPTRPSARAVGDAPRHGQTPEPHWTVLGRWIIRATARES
jgi:hypothetical protein